MVGASPGGIRLSELAATLGLKSPAVCHIVNTLAAAGVLHREGGRIELGEWIDELAERKRSSLLDRAGGVELLRLFRELPHRCFACFGVPRRDGLFWALQVRSDRPGVLSRPDIILSPFTSAAGLMDAAMRDAAFFEALESIRSFSEHGIRFWESRERYHAYLGEARERGYVVCPFDTGVQCKMAVPVFNRAGTYRAIVGCGISAAAAASDPVSKDIVLKSLKATALRLREVL